MTGWTCLSCGIDTFNWQLAGFADFNGDGVPDLVYQYRVNGQVHVNYYGGPDRATLISWACLSCGIDTRDWELKAVVDFDGNGVPDLVYQNKITARVHVNYYGGANRETFIGWACLSCGIDTQDWQLKGVARNRSLGLVAALDGGGVERQCGD
jgi:hypothetical protein